MGQYGNQPDFGVRATKGKIQGSSDNITSGEFLNGAALYVGTGGDLLVTLTGGDIGSGFAGGATLFKNVPDGSFLPIIVDYIWLDDGSLTVTSCSDIVALY